MASLSDLKLRIADELTRDDMGAGGEAEGALVRAIDSAIEHHANELFWFNRASGTVQVSSGDATVALPSWLRIPMVVSYNNETLIKAPLSEIEYRTEAGRPTHWAMNEGGIQLWPIPDSTYDLSVQGVAEFGTPATTNEWTTTAYDLIAARVKVILCRFPFRDPEGLALASQEEQQVLDKLRRETRKRDRTMLRPDLEGGTRYNIGTDI